jgi:hypothetical protein
MAGSPVVKVGAKEKILAFASEIVYNGVRDRYEYWIRDGIQEGCKRWT